MPLLKELSPRMKELRGKRKERTSQMAKIVSGAKQRELTSEEEEKLRALESEIEDLTSRIEELEDLAYADSEEDSNEDEDVDDEQDDSDAGQRTIKLKDGRTVVELGKQKNGQPKQRTNTLGVNARFGTIEYRKAFADYCLTGRNSRALQQDADIQGGYLVVPVQIANQIVKAIDNMLFMMKLCTQFPVINAQSLGVPSLDANPADSDWTGEISTVSEDSTMGFGRRDLQPRANTKLLKISIKLLQNALGGNFLTADGDDAAGVSFSGAEELIGNRLGYAFAKTVENAILNGSGVNRPLGLFVASTRGISTSRDISTGSTTNVTYAGLVNAQYAIKQGYNPAWLVSRDFMKLVRRLVDSQSRPLIIDPLVVGQQELLMGRPVYMSEYTPTTFTDGSYVGMYGDFKLYGIAFTKKFGLLRLNELFALTQQVGFLGTQMVDGMPLEETAFARLKCAA